MSHNTHKKLGSPFSNRITLNPSGKLSTRTSHEYSSVAESRASPVFRQLGHLRFSTQLSRAISNMRRRPSMFQAVALPQSNRPKRRGWNRLAKKSQNKSMANVGV